MLPAAVSSLERGIGVTKSPWGIPRAARVPKVQDEGARHDRAMLKPEVEPTTRICRTCARELPIEEFGRNGKRWRRYECRSCSSRRTQQGRIARPEVWRNAFLRRTYNISGAEYATLFVRQRGLCAICRKPERVLNAQGEPRHLHVDHDHKTGKVRSLLCSNCNTGLGSFGDDPLLLERAIAYLRRHE